MGIDGINAAHRFIGALHVLSFDTIQTKETVKQNEPEQVYEPEPVNVFISHSSEDNEFTTRLTNDLKKRGASVWVDFDQILHGDFFKRIDEGLRQSNWFILVVTPKALESLIIEMEVHAAFGLIAEKMMKGIIPVIAKPYDDNKLGPLLRPLHRYDATKDYQTALMGVLKALGLP